MTDRPIIFSAPMVRALCEGRKTQTRRHAWSHTKEVVVSEQEMAALERKGWQAIDGADEITTIARPTIWQRVKPGDRLHVEAVRVQRLQDISEEDARAEGISSHYSPILEASLWGVDASPVQGFTSAKPAFRDLWSSLHGPCADALPARAA